MSDKKLLFLTLNRILKAGFLLFLLAIFDSFFTDFGIRNHHIEEANPLMRLTYENSIFIFYAIKIGLPILLLYILTKVEPKLYFHLLIASSLVVYTIVLFQHLFWMMLITIA